MAPTRERTRLQSCLPNRPAHGRLEIRDDEGDQSVWIRQDDALYRLETMPTAGGRRTRMRIAIVSSYLGSRVKGGAEQYVVDLARSLSNGNDVVVLSGTSSDAALDVPVIALPGQAPVEHAAPFARRAAWHLRDQWSLRLHRALSRELRRLAPDVVQTNNVQGLSAAVFTAAAGFAHVHTAHDLSLLCVRAAMTRNGRPCAGRCADCRVQRSIRVPLAKRSVDHMTAVSAAVGRRLVEAGVVPPERISVVRLGVTPTAGRLRTLDPPSLRVGFLGMLAHHKGVLTLLDAFRSAPPAWSLVIAGEGPLEEDVQHAVAADTRITYQGHVSGEVKEALFDSIDVVVIPSECEEAASLVGVEAAARGIPAAVSNRGGLPEMPEAHIFRSGSSPDLLRALAWFYEGDRLRRASERLLARHEDFAWSTHAQRMEAILRKAVERPARSAHEQRRTATL
jgi:glycosyltransferase involved in cell wall biosynthesis